MKLIVALVLWFASACMVVAAPWKTDKFETGVMVQYSASQSSEGEEYYLVVECQVPAKWSIYVESPYDWQDGVSYPREIDTTLLADDKPLTGMKFGFDDRQLGEGIVAFAAGQEEAFAATLEAMASAGSVIELGYADRRARFSPEGSSAAIRYVRDNCR
ncbi:MAG TPA: hypothetical protein VIL84_13300 [Devosiaceae bacterium]